MITDLILSLLLNPIVLLGFAAIFACPWVWQPLIDWFKNFLILAFCLTLTAFFGWVIAYFYWTATHHWFS